MGNNSQLNLSIIDADYTETIADKERKDKALKKPFTDARENAGITDKHPVKLQTTQPHNSKPTSNDGRFFDWLATLSASRAAALLVALSASGISLALNVRHAWTVSALTGVTMAVCFAILWDLSKPVMCAIGCFHPLKWIRVASFGALIVLTTGSVVASVSFMGDSVDASASQSATKGIEFQSLERQRLLALGAVAELTKAADRYMDIDHIRDAKKTLRERKKESQHVESIEAQQAAIVRDIPKPSAGLLGWFLGAGIMLELLSLLSVAIYKGVK